MALASLAPSTWKSGRSPRWDVWVVPKLGGLGSPEQPSRMQAAFIAFRPSNAASSNGNPTVSVMRRPRGADQAALAWSGLGAQFQGSSWSTRLIGWSAMRPMTSASQLGPRRSPGEVVGISISRINPSVTFSAYVCASCRGSTHDKHGRNLRRSHLLLHRARPALQDICVVKRKPWSRDVACGRVRLVCFAGDDVLRSRRMHSPCVENGGSIVRSETPGDALFVNAKVVDREGRPIADVSWRLARASWPTVRRRQPFAGACPGGRARAPGEAAGRVARCSAARR